MTTLGTQLQQYSKELSNEQLTILKNTLCKDASQEEMKLFSQICNRTSLDPFGRQIYMVKRNGQITFQTSIDGFRLIAERSGLYEGQEDIVYYDKDGKQYEIWTKNEPPFAARAGVYKKNFKAPVRAIAVFSEYKPAQDFMWKKMPALMISKCAEALALRRAFPNDLSGLYTDDEMKQADCKVETPIKKEAVVVQPVQVKKEVISDQIDATPVVSDFRPLIRQKIYSIVKTDEGINFNRLKWFQDNYGFKDSKEILDWDEQRANSIFSDLDLLTAEQIDQLVLSGN